MDRKTFEHEMGRADAFKSENHDYWTGYQRGLRRQYHENFGTEQEHQLWLTADGDESRQQRSRGYRDGFNFTGKEKS